MERRIKKLNAYLKGWMAYYALADAKSIVEELQGWICRRLRACQWRQWKRVRTRIRELRAPGLADWKVFGRANDRRGPWAIAGTTLNSVFPTRYWLSLGLVNLPEFYSTHRKPQ